ncbi:CC0125/CC1285 family lipoprotein [Caldimonas aquatica]|uniref:Lipoprotein n=1 Tax=Caldimonas aquatica TaxID=376175 RepID=A0ABY6MSG2_9BURK|nr:hypothetical protein [Schlegelella aquatica]UZD54953.1 hypothetical protein OMP39_15015 [Schlegelella aquatica]
MKAPISSALAAIFLTACATAYRPYTFLGGGGWKEVQIADNAFKVTFEANGHMSKTQAADLALLRAAELALANGYSHFIIGSAPDDSRTGAYTTPSTTNINLTTYGNSTRGTAQTYGGQTYVFSFPAPSITVVLFKEKPPLSTTVYDAALVAKSIKVQYGIK